MDHNRRELLASLGLVLASLMWGLSYPLTKYVENCPTTQIIVVRFVTASVFLGLVFLPKRKLLNLETARCAFLCSFCITFMYVLSIIGIRYTTAVRSSFFTTLSFLIVPIVNFLLFRERIRHYIAVSALICLVGTFLLCYNPEMGGLVINAGDLLCFAAAACGSLHIVLVERISKKPEVNPAVFTFLLMSFVAIWGIVFSLMRGELHFAGTSRLQIGVMILMGIFCSGIAFTMQTYLEAIVPANITGIIFALEPVSGCIFSMLILGEQMSAIGLCGAAVIMLSVLYIEFARRRSA